ncbi:MAG: transcriptional regulator [Bacteroidetes bacterium]|nr:MAG: transcriptional regulator [Bacteroidota bacterium]
MFSKACEYGMRATIYVAKQSTLNEKVGVKAIAQAIESPEAFTGKIMQRLSKNGFVRSIKGPYGGFMIDESSMKTVKLSDIVTLFDGKKAYSGCILGLHTCNGEQPCPLHKESEMMLEQLRHLLESKTIYDIIYTKGAMNIFWLK